MELRVRLWDARAQDPCDFFFYFSGFVGYLTVS